MCCVLQKENNKLRPFSYGILTKIGKTFCNLNNITNDIVVKCLSYVNVSMTFRKDMYCIRCYDEN